MNYIKRILESKIKALSEEYSCILLTGPRQVGKTTLLKNIADSNRHYVTLDDLEGRALAKKEPATFFAIHPTPILIDEIQYAPELFPYIKIAIDNGAAAGDFWLTGSQSFSMMTLAQESLAGRVAVLHLSSLSQQEIYNNDKNIRNESFKINIETLSKAQKQSVPVTLNELYERIWKGSMPSLISGKLKDRDIFYGSYLETYIGRDVADIIPKVDKLLFSDFIRATAARAGQMLNTHSIATDVGISDTTAKHWLNILLKSDVIFYLRPFSNNLLKRTIKQEKLYFFDTGLVAFLTRYSSPDILMNGAIGGAILENYIVSEIRKSYLNCGKIPPLWYYRDRDGKEIDLIIEEDGKLYPIEIKRSLNPSLGIKNTFSILEKSGLLKGTGGIICPRQELSAVDKDTLIIPAHVI